MTLDSMHPSPRAARKKVLKLMNLSRTSAKDVLGVKDVNRLPRQAPSPVARCARRCAPLLRQSCCYRPAAANLMPTPAAATAPRARPTSRMPTHPRIAPANSEAAAAVAPAAAAAAAAPAAAQLGAECESLHTMRRCQWPFNCCSCC